MSRSSTSTSTCVLIHLCGTHEICRADRGVEECCVDLVLALGKSARPLEVSVSGSTSTSSSDLHCCVTRSTSTSIAVHFCVTCEIWKQT